MKQDMYELLDAVERVRAEIVCPSDSSPGFVVDVLFAAWKELRDVVPDLNRKLMAADAVIDAARDADKYLQRKHGPGRLTDALAFVDGRPMTADLRLTVLEDRLSESADIQT